MRIGLFHDCLLQKGGAQRVILEIGNKLNTVIITCGFNKNLKKWMKINSKIIDLGNFTYNINRLFSNSIENPIRFFFNRNKFNYDLYIFSGLYSFFASKNGNNNIWFCHSPNRLLYDLREYYLNKTSVLKRLILIPSVFLLTKLDQYLIKNNISKIVVNSKNVQRRVKKYYNMNSIVVYPPIDTKKFRFNKFGDFYLAVSRLQPEKRMDLIAKVFSKMPEKKLIIVGDGPEKKKILEIIKDSKNITLLDKVDDKALISLYSNCLATIYMPIDEDFGLVPLEGMASGKPCIAVNEGGCKETVINNKTGFLIKANEKELIKSVKNLDIKKAENMKFACLEQAKRFDIKECIKQWNNVIKESNKK